MQSSPCAPCDENRSKRSNTPLCAATHFSDVDVIVPTSHGNSYHSVPHTTLPHVTLTLPLRLAGGPPLLQTAGDPVVEKRVVLNLKLHLYLKNRSQSAQSVSDSVAFKHEARRAFRSSAASCRGSRVVTMYKRLCPGHPHTQAARCQRPPCRVQRPCASGSCASYCTPFTWA